MFKNSDQEKHSLGICIPVWNRGELFNICFDSLLKNLKGLEATIWIIDNGSDEKTKRIVENVSSNKYRIHKIFLPENMGIPYAANLFANAVQEDCEFINYKAPKFIMLMDADAYFKKPIKDMVELCNDQYHIGMVSGHDSIEHKAIEENNIKINGKNVLLKEKENERMITMLMKREEFLCCYPFPHFRNRDVDWEITHWNPNSMKNRNRRIFVTCDYVLHLGLDTSTWNKDKEVLASEDEFKEVKNILKKNEIIN